jgi:hypothetical protein
MLGLLYKPISALDLYICLIYAGNRLDFPYTFGRNITGTSQPTGLNDSLNPTPYNLLADSVPGPGPAVVAAGSIGTRI